MKEKRKTRLRKSLLMGFLCLLLVPISLQAAAAEQIPCGAESMGPGSDPMGDWGNNINILLIGQDQRAGVGGRRSDSMILCTFSPSQKALILTSLMRDLYVQIPGQGKNRINASYAFGGPELLKKTVEENFKIPVDGCIEVDFDQFPKVIDLLGGVTLELRKDEAREINRLVTWQKTAEGLQTLTGDQALVYSRIRRLDADSDFSRTERQRKLLSAVMEKHRNLSVSDALNLLKQMLPMVDTDLSYWQVFSYSTQVLPFLRQLEIVSQRIPGPGDGRETTVDGMSVIVPDLGRIREMLQKTLL